VAEDFQTVSEGAFSEIQAVGSTHLFSATLAQEPEVELALV
jgi:hypothetical protein